MAEQGAAGKRGGGRRPDGSVIQLAITLGAALGGELFDAVGWWSPFAFGLALLIISAIFAVLASRRDRHRHAVR